VTYLIDSDVVVDWLNGKDSATLLLATLIPDGLAISLITYGEIYEGIYFGRDPKASEAGFRRFLHGVRVLPLNRPIVRRFSFIRGDLRRRGQRIGDLDILIGATTLHHDLTLVTGNADHFERIDGLRLLEQA